MTPRQDALYWRLWTQACRARGWTPGDSAARHKLHLAALGYDVSHAALTNAELDQVLVQFRLAIDPDNLTAVMDEADPDRAASRRLRYVVSTAPPALVRKICRDKFGAAGWDSLEFYQLRQLVMTLKRISAGHARREGQGRPATAD